MKTIKEIADELGVSKQAVFKKIKREPLSTSLQGLTSTVDGRLTVSVDGEKLIKQAFSGSIPSTNSHVVDGVVDGVVDALKESIIVLKETLDAKDRQIEAKDRQLEEKDRQIERLHTLLDQQQQLQALAFQEKKALPEQAEADPEVKKPWWKLWK